MADKPLSFEDAVSRSTRIQQEQQRLAHEQKQVHYRLKEHVVRVNELHNTLFQGLPGLDGYERDFKTIGATDVLARWWVEDDIFTANFENTFRGDVHDFDVSFPLAYLQSGGEQRVRQDALPLREQQAKAQQQQTEEAVARDRACYEQLKARFEPSGNKETGG